MVSLQPSPGKTAVATGSCLCGDVRFTVRGELASVTYCHCAMCQRALTHYGAFTACAPEALAVEDEAKVKWYRSSPDAKRGFCRRCGSQLFWTPTHGRHVAISAGSLDQPTGLKPGGHLHAENVADYDRVTMD